MLAIMAKSPLQERVRSRLREWSADLTHQKIADHFHVNRSAITKLLAEDGSAITLDHIEGFTYLLQRSASEIVSEPGSLIQALTPMEAAIMDIVRKMDELGRHSLLKVLDWPRSATVSKRAGRTPDHLSPEDAMVLSLYRGMEDSDAQSGIVMQMRGYVQAKQERRTEPKRGAR